VKAYAAACGIEGDPIVGLRTSFETCIRVSRDDASQVGPLELMQQLNSLLSDLPGIWTGSTGNEISAAVARLRPRLDAVSAEIESRWFHHLATAD
jgi:hypothetical protein